MLLLSDLLSWISTVCWCFALLPQLWYNYENKSVEGLSPYLLILWCLGDSFNLVGCLLLKQLPFQIYLATYFVLNDIVLDLQYIYYNLIYSPRPLSKYSQTDIEESSVELLSDDNYSSILRENSAPTINSLKPGLSKSQLITTTTALLSISPASALPIVNSATTFTMSFQNMGLLFAWSCTIIYCSSRIPQLYHNFKRKSVSGISPLLFSFALLANLTYALSILTTKEIPPNLTYKQFIINELPYLLGSLGTIAFDLVYFFQRGFYRHI